MQARNIKKAEKSREKERKRGGLGRPRAVVCDVCDVCDVYDAAACRVAYRPPRVMRRPRLVVRFRPGVRMKTAGTIAAHRRKPG